MEGKKYILTDETMEWKGKTLHRIQAVRDIASYPEVKNGELGGWVESENNLSHLDNCWIYGNAKVYNNGRVSKNAKVSISAQIFDEASVTDSACITSNACISGKTHVFQRAFVSDNAIICGNSFIGSNSYIYANAKIEGSISTIPCARIGKNALIRFQNDVMLIGPIGSREDFTTFYHGCDDDIWVSCGCFNGNLDLFQETVRKKHKGSIWESQYLSIIPFVKQWVGNPQTKQEKPSFLNICCCQN